MGSFFTNVQVQLRDGDHDAALTAISGALEHWIETQGYERCDDGGDRTVVLRSAGDWIAIYDQGTEGQDITLLEKLATVAGDATNSAAIGVLVHDSDVLELRLCANGQVRDRFSSWPDYFDTMNARAKKRLAGQPDRWQEHLATLPSGVVDELEQVWRSDDTGAERVLLATAEILGWERTAVMMGFRYLPDLSAHLGTSGMRNLTFRLRQRPSFETPKAGPPVFSQLVSAPVVELSTGDPLQLMMTAVADGGPGQGVIVRVEGEALDKGLITLDEVSLRATERSNKTVREATSTLDKQGKAVMDFELHGAIQNPFEQLASLPPEVMESATQAMISNNIFLIINGRVRTPGEAHLSVSITPSENETQGSAQGDLSLQIRPASRRPRFALESSSPQLMFAGSAQGQSQTLRQMETPRSLFAVVALGLPQKDLAPLATRAFEQWHADMTARGGSRSLQTTLMRSLTKKPAQRKIRAAKLAESKPWKQIEQALGDCVMLSASAGSAMPMAQMPQWLEDIASGALGARNKAEHCFGFALSTTYYPLDTVRARTAVHLGFWLELNDVDASMADEAQERLIELVDSLVTEGNGKQAFLGRWAWTPSMSLDITPYEQVCGINGQCTTSSSWVGRYLRAVTPHLWLGPELWERVEGKAELKEITQVTSLDASHRVELKETASLDHLETVLETLLPSKEVYQEAMRELYQT